MNNTRRKMLDKVIEMLDTAYSSLEEIKDEEDEAFNNLPEGIQESERGERMEEVIDALDNALSSIDEAREQIEEAKG